MKPLEGTRVVELSVVVAAPSLGRTLEHLGADVIKVEPLGGEQFRFFGPSYQCPCREDENPIFDQYNGGKRSITLDLKKPEGMEAMMRLLETADVFLSNSRPGSMAKLGLDYDSLKVKFPRLIVGTVTGYGETGPDKSLPGFDTTAFWAASGFNSDISIKTEAYLPTGFPGGMGDIITGAELGIAVCSALYAREKTGKGDYVTASLFGTALWAMSLMTVAAQEKYGRKYPMSRYEASPTPYCCKDGEWIVFTILSSFEKQLNGVCKAIGKPEMASDPRFWPKENFIKPENTKTAIETFEKAFMEKTADEWLELLKANGVACNRMCHFRDATKSVQALENHFIQPHTMPDGETCMVVLPSCQSGNAGTPEFVRAPFLGEHSAEILRELGYDEKTIQNMAAEGAVGLRD